jgi:hypothetical protein
MCAGATVEGWSILTAEQFWAESMMPLVAELLLPPVELLASELQL